MSEERTCRTCGITKPVDTAFRRVNGYPLRQCRECYAARERLLRANRGLRPMAVVGRNETPETLRQVMDAFALEGGKVVHRVDSARGRAGDEVGVLRHGYRLIYLNGRGFMGHRVSYALKHGRWPAEKTQVDHINHEKSQTAPRALRCVTASENNANVYRARSNSRSGLLGVAWDKRDKRWIAQLTVDYRLHVVGRFRNKTAAGIAVARAKAQLQNVPISTAAKIALIALGKNPDSAAPEDMRKAIALVRSEAPISPRAAYPAASPGASASGFST